MATKHEESNEKVPGCPPSDEYGPVRKEKNQLGRRSEIFLNRLEIGRDHVLLITEDQLKGNGIHDILQINRDKKFGGSNISNNYPHHQLSWSSHPPQTSPPR
jgi:hypothetical protein